MTIPMIILAVGAVVLGGALSVGNTFTEWLVPSIGHVMHGDPVLNEYVIQGATLALVILGAVLAWMKYGRDEVPTSVPAGNALTEAARRDLYQDTVNETLFMMPAKGPRHRRNRRRCERHRRCAEWPRCRFPAARTTRWRHPERPRAHVRPPTSWEASSSPWSSSSDSGSKGYTTMGKCNGCY